MPSSRSTSDGKFLGLRVQTYANIGAYHTSDRSGGTADSPMSAASPATYMTPAIHVEVFGVITNTSSPALIAAPAGRRTPT